MFLTNFLSSFFLLFEHLAVYPNEQAYITFIAFFVYPSSYCLFFYVGKKKVLHR